MDDDDTDRLADALAKVASYKNGNTHLLDLLMQWMEGTPGVHNDTVKVLQQCGLLHESGAPNWQALQDRKPKQQTWEQAVRECITDPAEVERLLALADDATHEEVVAAVRGPA